MKFYDFSHCDFDDDLIGKDDFVGVLEMKGSTLRILVGNRVDKRVVFLIPQGKVVTIEGYTDKEVRHIIDVMEDVREELIDGIKAAERRR